MKLKIEFTKNKQPVPFDHLSNLNGYLHKVLGKDNEYHDKISIYSTSFLRGGKMIGKEGIDFPNGAKWFISSPDKKFITELIRNIYSNTEFAFGMMLSSVEIINYTLSDDGNGYYKFITKSPVLLKGKDLVNNKNKYLTYEDDIKKTSDLFKKIVLTKAKEYNFEINSDDFEIFFDYEYNKKKIKWVKIRNIGNKTSACPIIVKSDKPEVVDFIFNVGVGHSTGSGFGFLLQ